MKFAYEDLSPEQFEKLVTLICTRLLGIGVQGFATGPDGGRDAKFVGTAEVFPSRAVPWAGTTIIQAKHTNGYNKHFSETDFFSTSGSSNVIAEELPRIKRLRDSKELDHYLLFANRRLTGNAESAIRAHICKECGIPLPSVYLCGVEQLEMWLKQFHDVPQMSGIEPVDSPLIVSSDDLADVVEKLAGHMETVRTAFDTPPTPRTPYDTKNRLNNMTPDYAREQRRRYLKETAQIQRFLAAPENMALTRRYESVVEEFQLKITAKRKDYQAFDDVMNYLADLLFSRDPVLRQNKRLTRAMLFYMYWHCDIGKNEDATTDEALTS